MPLNRLKPRFSGMMFPGARNKFWGSFITQFPTVELRGSVSIADMLHEPLGFVSQPLRGSQERWETVNKEGFAIVSTFERLPYLLWGGVAIHCDHRNPAIFLVRTERPLPRRWHNVYKHGVCFSDSSRTLANSMSRLILQGDLFPVEAFASYLTLQYLGHHMLVLLLTYLCIYPRF